MQEWDISCWQRKFLETTGFWITKKGKEQLYISDISDEDGILFYCKRTNGKDTTEREIEPTYSYVPSGYYYNRRYDNHELVLRKDKKTFKVGLSRDGFRIEETPYWYDLTLTRGNIRDVLLTGKGVINRNFYMNQYDIYYLGKIVAKVKNKKILTYTNALDQEIADLFKGTEWTLF